MRRLLLTGFEPFDGFRTNPSGELAKRLDGTESAGFTTTGAVLHLDYTRITSELDTLIEAIDPDTIVLTGQAERASLTVERIAVNSVSLTKKDNYGNAPGSDIILDGAPAAYFCNLDPHAIVAALRTIGIPAFVSYHAGTFGCNYALFHVLHRIYSGGLSAKATFMHIPPLWQQAVEKESQILPNMDFETVVRATSTAIRAISKQS